MGYEGIRGRTGARAWEVIHIYTGSFTPSPDPTPFLPPPDLDKEGRVDNQRDTPPNTRLTVQPIRATSGNEVEQLIQSAVLREDAVFMRVLRGCEPGGARSGHSAPNLPRRSPPVDGSAVLSVRATGGDVVRLRSTTSGSSQLQSQARTLQFVPPRFAHSSSAACSASARVSYPEAQPLTVLPAA